ncbi:MAG TPA: hypothetical protein H9841_02525, partial [Candidatus Flavonifractor merdigallinarum]|nr:hypothetical protein [Candidatus Flavonifractor merdigallinarum]
LRLFFSRFLFCEKKSGATRVGCPRWVSGPSGEDKPLHSEGLDTVSFRWYIEDATIILFTIVKFTVEEGTEL